MSEKSTNPKVDQRYYVETAARTLQILEAIAEIDTPAPLSVIVAKLGWTKPTVYRLVRTLEAIGALRQHDGRGYVLGPALITLGQAALRATGLVEIARPHMQRLHDELDETVVLTVLDGDEVIYVDRIEADKLLIPRMRLGSRLPAYCTSTGQVLLASLPDEEVRLRLADRTFEPLGPNTLRSIDELLERLNDVRKKGYCINDEQLTVGHRSAAAPILDHTGSVAAALSVSVPTARISLKRLTQFAEQALVPTAAAVSVELGAERHVIDNHQ